MIDYLNIVIGIGLFVLGLRKFPTAIEKLLSRRIGNEIQLQGVLLPYFIGVVLSIIFQASSIAVIVMMIYMLYARIRFHSAYAYMLGATLGTSLKFWIIAPDMHIIAAALIIISQSSFLFLRSYRYRSHLSILTWIGVMFLGWAMLKDGVQIFIDTENIRELTALISDASTIELFAAGTFLTALVQSSSLIIKTSADIMNSTAIGLYEIGLITLGANVGTTITALIVSIWLPIKAKRLALAHFGIKLLGALLCFITYQTFLSSIDNIFIKFFNVAEGDKVYAIHTFFNAINSFAFLGLYPAIDKIMSGILKEKKTLTLEETTYLSKSLIQLLSNVPEEGLVEAKKQFKSLIFKIKAYEDRVVMSFFNQGIRKGLENYSVNLISHMRALEDLLLIIRHKHPKYEAEAHEVLIDFYRLRKILTRVDDLNVFVQDFSREDLNANVQLLGDFLDEWEKYRSRVWNSIFNEEKGDTFSPLSQAMSTYFLKDQNKDQNIRPNILTASYRMGLFLISLAESWELLWRHQKFDPSTIFKR